MPVDTASSLCSTLTSDEATLYDRQIRLWGVDAQNRLRGASVLLIGLNLSGAEIAKNLVLAGINQLDLIDERLITNLDKQCHFLIPHDTAVINKKASSIAAQHCRSLNPLVEVSDISIDPFDKDVDKSFLSKYSLVCLIDYNRSNIDLAKISSLNEKCRRANVKFVVCGNFGFFAYAFFDFIDFEYYQELMENNHNSDGDHPPDAKRPKTALPAEKIVVKQVILDLIEKFTPFDVATKRPCIRSDQAKKFRKLPGAFYQFNLLNRYCEKTHKNPSNSDDDVACLSTIHDELVDEVSNAICDVTFEIRRFSPKRLYGEISPVCAIIGGITAQQIIQALSQNEQPINNCVLYDGYDCSVCKLPFN